MDLPNVDNPSRLAVLPGALWISRAAHHERVILRGVDPHGRRFE